MAAYVTTTVRACFAALCQMCTIRSSLSHDAVMTPFVSKLDYCNYVLVGVSTTLQRQLQSVLCAVARLVFSARSSAHNATPVWTYWLKMPEWIQFHLCMLVYHCLHSSVPQYLAETLHLIAYFDSRRCLRSSCTFLLLVLPTCWITLGDRTFPVAAARAWNALLATIRTALLYLTLWQHLKTFLFTIPDTSSVTCHILGPLHGCF